MIDQSGGKNRVATIPVVVTTMFVSYLPAANVFDIVTRWLSPMQHAEEAMGRGIATAFIGGPLVALTVAAVAGWLVHRSKSAIARPIALSFIAGCTLLSIAIARSADLF